ncbi:MAG: biopolymer transporter ExbD, partial [Chromatiales bacterium]|nr:biopolymer transporter ExbD [Chromatiales bacterium]
MMKARRWRRRRQHGEPELNMIAFLNLMIILTPFLLVTAVFSRVAILELVLPGRGAGEVSAQEPLRLEV